MAEPPIHSQPLLSVLIPVYNERRTLRTIIGRVLASPVGLPMELVCVDDGSRDGSAEILEGLRKDREEQMAALAREKAGAGVPIEARVLEGTPFSEICKAARAEGANLIVMGTRGLTGLKHVLIGSTAERVVRKAPCPVLVLKPHDFDFQLP